MEHIKNGMSSENTCGGCTRFRENSGFPSQKYNCICHKREDNEVFADAKACDIYLDKIQCDKEEEERKLRELERRAILHEETKNNPPVKLEFSPSYDFHTDNIIERGEPKCPYCGEMPYSLEECVFCGTKFLQDDEETKNFVEQNSGEKEEISECLVCGEKYMHMISRRVNGEWHVGHGYCDKCGMKFIV